MAADVDRARQHDERIDAPGPPAEALHRVDAIGFRPQDPLQGNGAPVLASRCLGRFRGRR